MNVRVFTHLTWEIAQLRGEVFLKEQGFREEFDPRDNRSTHILLEEAGQPVGVCRVFREADGFWIGRVAVRKAFRGRGLGREIIQNAEAVILQQGGTKAILAAQVRAQKFYETLGYHTRGEAYLDEVTPTIRMEKELKKG